MATSPLFGWVEPDDTSLVKDGAAAIRTLGNSIDASMGDLLGGTTGQILAKQSNTNMDFQWVSPNPGDITAVTAGTGISGGGTSGDVTITNSMATAIDAKGDLVAGTGADAFARLAAGNNGETLVADSSTSTGLRYQGNFAAGKNKCLNSDFSIWQRGTSFSNLGFLGFAADRWQVAYNGNTTSTTSQQTFTPGASPIAGYDGQFFMRSLLPVIGTTTTYQLLNTIENVQTFNGQTVTLSFFAKADTARTLSAALEQNFGSGGSSSLQTAGQSVTLTTSWQRFSLTYAVPSISGKTIGAGSFLRIVLTQAAASGSQLDLWGFQLEAGSVATAFQTATGTIQGELAACQRYYWRWNAATQFATCGVGTATSSTIAAITCYHPVPMRTTISSIDGSANSTLRLHDWATGYTQTLVSIEISALDLLKSTLNITVASGLTQYRIYNYGANNSTSAFIGFNAEL